MIVYFYNSKPFTDIQTLEIELGSHTDCQSSFEYNMILSDNRAKASAAYIKERITNPSRISGKGYGETLPLNKCKNKVLIHVFGSFELTQL